MRILRLIPYFSDAFGGPVRHVKMVTRELQRLGHETVVFTTDLADKSGRTQPFDGGEFEVRAFPVKWSVADYFYTPRMKAALDRENFDLVHAHCYRNYQADLAPQIARKRGTPLVFTAHGTLGKFPDLRGRVPRRVYDAFRRRLVLRSASRVVALSSEEVKEYARLGVSHERIVRIPHGVDTEFFKPADDGTALRERLGLGPGPVILFAGRLHERKGLQYLIPAFRRVLIEFPQAKLLICGPDYGYGGKLAELTSTATTGDGVVLAGEIEHRRMPEFYNASDVVVLPARYEVFGHVLAEAASCGKPVVATDWGWAADFFEHGEDSLLLPGYGDVSALTEALLALLRDSEMRVQLGSRARRKIVRTLSWEACAGRHIDTYMHLLAGGET